MSGPVSGIISPGIDRRDIDNPGIETLGAPESLALGGAGPAPVSPGFMALYTVAQVGAFICFVPLLQILLPLRAASVDHAHAATLLSIVALSGAIAASLSNIIFGALSDRTRSARGRRRPWLFAGLAATLASYALIWSASTPWRLFAGVIVFQSAFNALFSPLTAVLADDVPNRQKGLLSALLGLGYPLGSLAGAMAVGAFVMPDGARYAVLATLVALCILPFTWQLRGAAVPTGIPVHSKIKHPRLPGMHAPDFARAWIGRLLVITAVSTIQGYMLFFLQSRAAALGAFPTRPEAAFAQLAAIVTVCNIACGLLSGWLSDRTGRRTPLVVTGGTCVAAGIACIALAPSWHTIQAATVLYGCGAGVFSAVDLALMLQLLPSLQHAGRDLGIVNLSNTLPQIIAPLLALHVLHGAAPDYPQLFLLAAAAAMLGALCVCGIKTAR